MHLLKFDEYLLQMVCQSMSESEFINSEDWVKYKSISDETIKFVKKILSEIKNTAQIDVFTPFPYSTKKELLNLAAKYSETYANLNKNQIHEVNKHLNLKVCSCNC
jgi:7-cyano-7-deazaguanine synthase in queuosine biosynthesis